MMLARPTCLTMRQDNKRSREMFEEPTLSSNVPAIGNSFLTDAAETGTVVVVGIFIIVLLWCTLWALLILTDRLFVGEWQKRR